jgi:hypothetical protein
MTLGGGSRKRYMSCAVSTFPKRSTPVFREPIWERAIEARWVSAPVCVLFERTPSLGVTETALHYLRTKETA